MILLLLTSSLLFFITWFTGVLTKQALEKFLGVSLFPNAVEIFLLGLISSFIYFNLLSFFLPVNAVALLPLFIISLIACASKQHRTFLYGKMIEASMLFTKKENVIVVIPFVVLFVVHAVFPPSNWDSSGYHYTAIKWYEEYKVVPGLANVHARLAYNPAGFIVSAAYSFTKLFGQAIYPLNVVLALLFFAWLIKKILLGSTALYKVVFAVATILLFRISLVNIPCPSSDLLSGMLLFYCGIRSFEFIKVGKQSLPDYLLLFILFVFAISTKLSTIPALLVVPFLFFFVIKKDKKPALLIKGSVVAAVILLPWMGRNLIMTGYLLYPLYGTNLFHFDWSVPDDVFRLDYVYSKFGPHADEHDLATLQQMNMMQLFKSWMQHLRTDYFTGFLTALSAMVSPALWLLFPATGRRFSQPVFLLWCLYYLFFWVWVTNAPEFRFGLAYIVLASVLPLLELSSYAISASPKIPAWLLALPFYFCCWHYALAGIRKDSFYRFSLADCWLKPLRSYRYFINNDVAGFEQVKLRNGVTLYLSDRQHECLNVDGPCMIWRYGKIEMRGNKIEDGFRNIKDEVHQNYPFINASSK